MWKIFIKTNQPGWASIIPVYNTIIFLQIIRRPVWWIVLLLIPFVNVVIAIMMMSDFVKAFGKGIGYFIGILLLPFIFYPMLAFGDAKYLYGQEVNMDPNLGKPDSQPQTSNPSPPPAPTSSNPIDPTKNDTI